MAERYQMVPMNAATDSALTFSGAHERQVSGRHPSICVNDHGKVVEVHQPSFGAVWSNKLSYQVGTIKDDFSMRWSQEMRRSELSEHAGSAPRVALNNNNVVVVVYEANRQVHCHIGSLDTDNDEITWTWQGEISLGRYPAIALNNAGQMVVAYESILGFRTYYRVAQLQPPSAAISWSKESRLFNNGAEEISLAVNQAGCVVAVARGWFDKLYFKIGEIQSSGGQFTIDWDSDVQSEATSNCRPCISINDDSKVVVAFQTKTRRQLSYRVGKVTEKRITWLHKALNYDMGCNPTIALCNNGKWVEEHETNSAYRGHKLFYRVGQLHDLGVRGGREQNE